MGHSTPPNPNDPHGGSISGLTVIVGLVLLVIAGSGFAVATYLAMGPASLRHRAIARAIAEREQTHDDAGADLAAPATETPGGDTLEADGPYSAPRPETPSSATMDDGPHAGTTGDAGQRPNRKSDPSDVRLTQLSPIEMLGTGTNAGDWRGAVTSGGLAFGHAVSLRPIEDQGVAQIAFALKARYTRFGGFAAIIGDQTNGAKHASRALPEAVFRVYGDGNLLWESGPLTGSGKRQAFECDVSGVDVLTLVAESQSPASISNFAWGDPTLRAIEKPAPATEPPPPKTP